MKSELRKHALSGRRKYDVGEFDDLLHPQLFDVIQERRLERKEKTTARCPGCKSKNIVCGDTYCVCKYCQRMFPRS